MHKQDAKELEPFRDENARLKRLLPAEAEPEKIALKFIAENVLGPGAKRRTVRALVDIKGESEGLERPTW